MINEQTTIETIDAYIAQFPAPVQQYMTDIRLLVHQLAPDCIERMAYGMPTFFLNENLVHFAGYKKHIGFYPSPSGITAFEEEIKIYTYAKGSVQFPLDQPMPMDLIRRIIAFRVEEVLKKPVKKPKKSPK